MMRYGIPKNRLPRRVLDQEIARILDLGVKLELNTTDKDDEEEKKAGKLRYYYISALYHTGKAKEALELLEENGGLEIPDIREGEDSIAQLYLDIQKTLTGKDVPLPFKYDFRAGF